MKAFFILFTVFTCVQLRAQVNAYAQVSAISSTNLTIASSNETYGSFAAGMPVIIMQMQDNVIGSNNGNTSSFGNLSSIQSTGQYEIAHITSVTRSSGVITQLTIGGALSNTYNVGSNRSVQVISYPLLGSPNYTTTSDITAVPWNGAIGGVVAFRVTGTLTLNHNIHADYAGFRGGTTNAGTAGSCDNATYITSANDLNANKGESIYKVTNTSYAAGRGKVLNGGGGGNSHNGGGGGGSNASAGGEGGKGYSCTSNAGGLGGVTLYSLIGTNRIFMGGGAGAGEANNNFNTAGGAGGGIVIISANQVVTTGSGSQLRISANGQTAADVGNDGAGGGGAGGSLILHVNAWNIASTKTLLIAANGGSGGNVGDAASHGGGGGGGQGALLFNTAVPTGNITVQALNGAGGRNYAGGTFAESGAGADNAGIFTGSFALLPIQIVSFKGKKAGNVNEISWYSVHEADVDHYEVQRSADGASFKTIAHVAKASASYTFSDDAQQNDVYYRIAINNNNGRIVYSGVVLIKGQTSNTMYVQLAPNPVRHSAKMNVVMKQPSSGTVQVMNSLGIVVHHQNVNLAAGENEISIDALQFNNGTYHIVITAGNSSSAIKMLVQR